MNEDKNYSRGKISLDPPKFTQSCVFYSPKAQNPIEQKAISHSLCQHWKRIYPGNKKKSHQQSINEIAVSLGAGGARSIFFCDGGNNNC
jgi:hypothetical protein